MMAAAVSAEVHVYTKSYGNEVTFEIVDKQGDMVCSGGPYPSNNDIVTGCAIQGSGNTLRCIDKWGDGWHGGYILIGGKKYCENFRSGHLQVE